MSNFHSLICRKLAIEGEIDMKIWNYLAALLLLISMILPAVSQEQIALTVYVHEGDLNGALLSGVKITGQDASGNEFDKVTDSSGAAVISGTPGVWQFAFQKEGYDAIHLTYNATQTGETAAYLEKSSAQDQVALTVYVHEGDLNGALLSDVLIKGQDANGNQFAEVTDSSGAAVISGTPGVWQFAFQKEGYDIIFLTYNATQTDETAAYIEKAT
jgi:hypothetical protein